MIHIEGSKLADKCNQGLNCALLVGLFGGTEGVDALARLRVLESANKLYSERPVL